MQNPTISAVRAAVVRSMWCGTGQAGSPGGTSRLPGKYLRCRQRPPGGALLCLAVAGLLCTARLVGAQEASGDQSIAEAFLRRAEVQFEAGEEASALALLERSLEFDPRFSESLYLRAQIQMKRQETLHLARSGLEAALAGARWSSTSPRQAQAALARVYVQTRRYVPAEDLLRAAAPDRGLGGEGSALLADLWVQTLSGRGRLGEAEELLDRALRRYPDAPRLYVRAGALLAERGRIRRAAEVLDRGLADMPASPELLFARIRVEADPVRRRELLERYFDSGGRDPEAALILLLDAVERASGASPAAAEPGSEVGGPEAIDRPDEGWSRAAEALELFLELQGDRQVPLVDRARESLMRRYAERDEEDRAEPYEGLLERLGDALAGYTGARVVDSDRDGLYEERYEYRNGALELWLLDRDQDGLAEVLLEYAGEQPSRLVLFVGIGGTEGTVEYVYSRYPYLRQLVFTGAGSRRVYEVIPSRYTFEALQPRPEREMPPVQSGPDHPLGLVLRLPDALGEPEARRRAVRMAEYLQWGMRDPAGPADRLYTYLNGEVVRLEQEPDAEGRYRHRILYEDGRPVSGYRDLDGDGIFETREVYAAGVLRELRVDLDGDGNPEFVELFEAGSRGGSEKRWDYNSDGRIDSRQLTLADGSVVREFSSRLDGSFDLRAVFRDGRLEEFRRGGRVLPVRRVGPGGEVYRIGPARAWSELPDPLTEGLHRRGGSRLFVFSHQGKIYVGEFE